MKREAQTLQLACPKAMCEGKKLITFGDLKNLLRAFLVSMQSTNMFVPDILMQLAFMR